jgi:hypothetical protein
MTWVASAARSSLGVIADAMFDVMSDASAGSV